MTRSSSTVSRSVLRAFAPRPRPLSAGPGSVPFSMPLGFSLGRPLHALERRDLGSQLGNGLLQRGVLGQQAFGQRLQLAARQAREGDLSRSRHAQDRSGPGRPRATPSAHLCPDFCPSYAVGGRSKGFPSGPSPGTVRITRAFGAVSATLAGHAGVGEDEPVIPVPDDAGRHVSGDPVMPPGIGPAFPPPARPSRERPDVRGRRRAGPWRTGASPRPRTSTRPRASAAAPPPRRRR